jgi:ParB-like chromosome segregation protein Spo0J
MEAKDKIDIQEFENSLLNSIEDISLKEKVELINSIREIIHNVSPFKNEPVDYVKWVWNESIVANDYNPNKVAPPEMELLEVSIMNDGYTQPIVTWQNEEKDKIEVIDGFHRNRVGKESKIVNQRIQGYLPTVVIRKEQSGKNDRIASTIRHNRARGKHQVDAMSEIVIELKNRNWTNSRISKQLGMDEEEVLRLCQISGLEHLFSDRDFSRAWISDESNEKYIPVHDKLLPFEIEQYRAGNTNDKNRIFHTYDKWECYPSGFYESKHPTKSNEECAKEFVEILSDQELFASILERVIVEWKYSCEHYLTNKSMNRIAWLGQAAVCLHSGIPSRYSGSWFDMSEESRSEANETALTYLNKWLLLNSRSEVTMREALNIGRQIELY